MRKPRLDPDRLQINRLRPDEAVPPFKCDDEDLNEFLRDDATHLQEAGVTQVYLARYDGELVGYSAVLTSEIKLKTSDVKRLRPMTYEDFHVIPAIKIGRLATSLTFKDRFTGCGTQMVRYIAYQAQSVAEEFGCRLLIVDAYERSQDFYQKLGFRKAAGVKKWSPPDVRNAFGICSIFRKMTPVENPKGPTVPMWLDLHQNHSWL